MVRLIVMDVGSTLGTFGDPSTIDVLDRLSPLPRSVVAEETRRFLHTAPKLTPEVIADVQGALLIRPEQWPDPWPQSRFIAFDYTKATLARLTSFAPLVVLSNVTVTDGPRFMNDLREQCGQYLDKIYTSFELARRKPDPRLWLDIAQRHNVRIDDVVHVGDLWHNDVLGAIAAGARAIFLSQTKTPPPKAPPLAEYPAGPDRLRTIDDLRGVEDVINSWQ